MNKQSGFTVLVIMVLVSLVLLSFSVFMLRRRTNLPQPTPPAALTDTPPAYDWTNFENKTYGIKFRYPQNIFTINANPSKIGAVTRVFLGSADIGTITAEVLDRQFDPKNIINESLRPVSNASALSIAGQIGYQYQDQNFGCNRKAVQVPLAHQTAILIFASCDDSAQPQLIGNQDLIRQVLDSVKLSPPATTTVKQFNIIADDRGANPSFIDVRKDDMIQITISVGSNNVSNGGLEFRSSAANTGTIFSGSNKTVTFKADQSFELTPYWPSVGVNNNYTIKVIVAPPGD